MSTSLINIGDTWFVPEPVYVIGRYYEVSYVPEPLATSVIDPKLERQYNLARAKNNKNEMRRLEKLLANH